MISRHENSKDILDTKLELCKSVLRDDPAAIERVCRELSEDEVVNGVKYFEVSLNPYNFLSEDKTDGKVEELVMSVLSALEKAEQDNGVRFGLILQYSKGMREESKYLLNLCRSLKEKNVVGLELSGYDFNIEEDISDDSENVDFLLFRLDLFLLLDLFSLQFGLFSLQLGGLIVDLLPNESGTIFGST